MCDALKLVREACRGSHQEHTATPFGFQPLDGTDFDSRIKPGTFDVSVERCGSARSPGPISAGGFCLASVLALLRNSDLDSPRSHLHVPRCGTYRTPRMPAHS